MFTKKNYIEIAKIIKKIDNPSIRVNVWSDFEALLERDNPRFNGSMFAVACGVMNPPKKTTSNKG